VAARLAEAVVQLEPTEEDSRKARNSLLGLLADPTNGGMAAELASVLIQLGPTEDDAHHARQTLVKLLAGQNYDSVAARLASGVMQLAPTVNDLSNWHTWVTQPTIELLAAVRRNSPLSIWLAALPSLPSLFRMTLPGPGLGQGHSSAVRAAVGWVVTPARWTRRWRCSMANST
jgi:hypothetical protein